MSLRRHRCNSDALLETKSLKSKVYSGVGTIFWRRIRTGLENRIMQEKKKLGFCTPVVTF